MIDQKIVSKNNPLWFSSIVLSLFLFCTVQAQTVWAGDDFPLREVTFGTGYAFGELKFLGDLDPTGFDLVREEDDFRVVPFFASFGYDLNSAIGIEERRGHLLFGLEPFVNLIYEPKKNVEAGIALFLKYDYPLLERMDIYLEASVGPMYFGIDTKLQGVKGFTFLDQLGAGVKWHVAEDKSINAGYRFRHISSAGLREPNKSINSHAVIVGISKYY